MLIISDYTPRWDEAFHLPDTEAKTVAEVMFVGFSLGMVFQSKDIVIREHNLNAGCFRKYGI